VQIAIDQGATSVEQIHKTIADLPFSVLEKNGLLNVEPEQRDELWNKSFGQVYDAIRRVNQEVGELATSAFEGLEDQLIIQKNIKAETEEKQLEESKATVIESPLAVEPKTRVV
jgi:hypothetical protein